MVRPIRSFLLFLLCAHAPFLVLGGGDPGRRRYKTDGALTRLDSVPARLVQRGSTPEADWQKPLWRRDRTARSAGMRRHHVMLKERAQQGEGGMGDEEPLRKRSEEEMLYFIDKKPWEKRELQAEEAGRYQQRSQVDDYAPLTRRSGIPGDPKLVGGPPGDPKIVKGRSNRSPEPRGRCNGCRNGRRR